MKGKRISVRIEDFLFQKLIKQAKILKLPYGYLVRQAVEKYLGLKK